MDGVESKVDYSERSVQRKLKLAKYLMDGDIKIKNVMEFRIINIIIFIYSIIQAVKPHTRTHTSHTNVK